MCEKCRGNEQFVMGALIGTVVGAALGVLLAPTSGKETREKLKKSGVEYLDIGKDSFEELRGKAEPIIENLEHKILPVLQELQKRAGEFSEPMKQEVGDKIMDLTHLINKEKKVSKKKFFSNTK